MNIFNKYLKTKNKPPKRDSEGRISHWDIDDINLDDYLKPFDKKVAQIVYKEFRLPYTVDHILNAFETNHNMKRNVVMKSLERLDKVHVLTLNKNHVFVEGGTRNEKWVGYK